MKPYYQSDSGDVVLYHGDCRAVMAALADGSVSAVVTDPPYNVGLLYRGDESNDRKADYQEWCAAWFGECRRLSSTIAISCGQANVDVWAKIEPPDWWLAWWKPAAMGRCSVGFNNWEPIAFYGKVRRLGCDVIRATIKPDKSLSGHPCPKPLEWATRQLQMMCPPSGTILDPFAGSGTTLLAARLEGMKAIGIEQSEEYCEIIVRRLEGRCGAKAESTAGTSRELSLFD